MIGPVSVVFLLASQSQVVDRAVLVVHHAGREVARERYVLREGPLADRTPGHFLESDGTWGSTVVRLRLEAGHDGGARDFALEITSPGTPEPSRIVGQAGRERFLVRALSAAGERARELQVPGPPIVLLDSAFASYALVGHRLEAGDTTFVAVLPAAARRVTVRAADRGRVRTVLGGIPTTLRQLDLDVGGERQVLWLCPEDRRLVKLEVPTRNIVVERLPTGS